MARVPGGRGRAGQGAATPGEARRRVRARAATLIKVVHSLLVFVMGGAALTVLVDGVTGRRDVWLALALVVLAGEGIVYLANGRRCPLTTWARRLGDPTGHDWLFERLLPEAYVLRVAPFFAWVTLLGLLAMGFRWLLRVPV